MSNSLLVPITLEVLLANQALRARDTFLHWRHTYANLSSDTFHSSEPHGFADTFTDDRTGAFLHWTLPRALRSSRTDDSAQYPLVPNRWLVARMSLDDSGASVLKAWVVESDCPADSAATASYFLVDDAVVQSWQRSPEPTRQGANPVAILTAPVPVPTTSLPPATGSYTVNLGNHFDLAAWAEQAKCPLFLTAVAPGNLAFSAYMPFNEGIFSFYDDLSDAPADTKLSYLVAGWYSDASQDIVASGSHSFTGAATTAEVLAALNWTLAGDNTPAPDQATSLYTGMAFDLHWQRDAKQPPSPDQLADVRATQDLTVALANTGVDAFSTLAGAQLTQKGKLPQYADQAKAIELLRAFHYDLLPLLNEVNGDALLAERVRQEWFSSKAGGTRWVIVADQPAPGTRPDPAAAALTAAEQAWLLQLNRDQQALDEALEKLHGLQWDLHAAWWKTGFLNARDQQMVLSNPQTNPLKLDASIPAAQFEDLLNQTLGQLEAVHSWLAKVPQPQAADTATAQAAFLSGVAAFASQQGLGAGKVLKAVAQPRFWKPGNPNVLISGVTPSALTDPDDSLVVRLAQQQVSALTVPGGPVITPATLGSTLPTQPNMPNLPEGLRGVYEEFFLLDPTNAPQLAAQAKVDAATLATTMQSHDPAAYATTGRLLPALPLTPWQQQWHPLYLEWEVAYADVPYECQQGDATIRNWTFNGTDYDLSPNAHLSDTFETISGRSLLSPHTQFTFGARLRAFVDQYGPADAELLALYQAIDDVDKWRFLSQELEGFNELLTQRDPRAFRKPTTEPGPADHPALALAQVMGYPGTASQPPYDTPPANQGLVGSVPAVKVAGPSDFPFHGIRSGQFYFSHLVLYDKFGRQLELVKPGSSGVLDAQNFPLVRDAAVVPTTNLTQVNAPCQLPPRLLQPARLDMLLVDQREANHVLGLDPAVNPVCGWVLANHLNQSLLVFAPDGTSLGELTPVGAGVQWAPPPHSTVTQADIAAQSPQLGAFVAAALARSAPEFQTLLGTIDSTLWTTEPLGARTDQNMSVLIGRPLALVRLRLQFALDGPPLASCDWASAPPASTDVPPFTTSQFSIRLGDLAAREDGVIGYFEGQDYTVFNSVAAPPTGQDYVREIGPLAAPQDPAAPAAGSNYLALPFDGRTSRLLTLLVDPRADIHATTGLLPVKAVTLPRQFVDSPLANLEVTFRMGPLLSRLKPVPATGSTPPPFVQALSYLPVSERHGSWSWWESQALNPGTPQASLAWQGYGLADATTTAALGSGPATLREGYLQLVTNQDPEASE